MIELEKDPAAHGLGISLRGNKDGSRARMSVYVADVDPQGPAGLDGRIRVGDELLEVRRGVNRKSKRGAEKGWSPRERDKIPESKLRLVKGEQWVVGRRHG